MNESHLILKKFRHFENDFPHLQYHIKIVKCSIIFYKKSNSNSNQEKKKKMSKPIGGFSGKALTPDNPWSLVKLFLAMLPAAMFANKMLQGNIWGIPNKEHGITPITEVMKPPIDKYVDGYIEHSIDTSGFVGDNGEDTPRSNNFNKTPYSPNQGAVGGLAALWNFKRGQKSTPQ